MHTSLATLVVQAMDLEGSIIANIPFEKLAANVKQNLGNSKKEWDKHVVDFSKAHQLRWKPNIGSARDICSSTSSLSLTYDIHPSLIQCARLSRTSANTTRA